jgi:deoxyribodipyrimidine photolyase-related protein
MMLAEIHPDDIHRLMNELFIDAYEWNSVPNVYGILRLDSHGLFGATAMTTSASIMQLSNYQRGQWSDVWDGLFLKFIQKHKTELVRTAAQRAAVHRFERLDADRKRIIGYRADDFLACATA